MFLIGIQFAQICIRIYLRRLNKGFQRYRSADLLETQLVELFIKHGQIKC